MMPKPRDDSLRVAESPAVAASDDALADAAALGVPALAGVLTGAQDGIAVIDVERRFVYANPAGCEMFGYTLDQLRGRDFLKSIPVREHAMMAARFAAQLSGSPSEVTSPFTCNLIGPDGTEREIVYSRFALEVAGRPLDVAIFRDLTGPRAAGRAAAGLAQAAGQLVGAEAAGKILTGLARHAVEGTRALSCGITVAGEDRKLEFAGAYGPDGPGYGQANPAWIALAEVPVARVIEAMTLGEIVLGDAPGNPVVMPEARAIWEADPLTRSFAVNLNTLDWRAGVFLPLSWRDHVVGFFAVFLPADLVGPSEEEVAVYTALADQAAIVVINARLNAQAALAATASERARLARELHDSVSQGLFSMTMHARAAQVSMARTGVDGDGSLGRSIGELAKLTRGALAEMRALIFELRPTALAEEGLLGALRKQAAALSAREDLQVEIDGPEERLALTGDAEQQLYLIASEALHNVINHAGADCVTVTVVDDADRLRLEVRDDGAGFDLEAAHSSHLGLSLMAQRAATIRGQLQISSSPGNGTTVAVTMPTGHVGRPLGAARTGEAPAASSVRHLPAPAKCPGPRPSGDPEPVAQGGTNEEPDHGRSELGRSSTLADAAALGLRTLAGVLAGTQEGIAISDASRCFTYVNPAVCRLLGRSSQELRGQHFLSVIPAREHGFRLGRFSELRSGAPARYSGTLVDREGGEHDAVYSTFPTEIAGSPHTVAFVRDVTGAQVAARAAAALAQAASQVVRNGDTNEILAEIARHAVEGTRALSAGIMVMGDDHKLFSGGGYSPEGANFGDASRTWNALEVFTGEEVIAAMTDGAICVGDVPGKPVVLPDARSAWEANPITKGYAERMARYDWRAACVCPLSWENRVFGFLRANLPSGVAGPNESELTFYVALADQAAVAVTITRLNSQAGQAAALTERSRLARELHDSVSQGLFSMTMHARAAQLAMDHTGLDKDGALGQSITELAQLARGAMAEMRALIFELQPAALAEEGLVAALGKQAAALSARAGTLVTSQGPAERLGLDAQVEEHLYRIASEALHNVINHAHARTAAVRVIHERRELRVEVSDDGAGFDQGVAHPGHLGLSTMAERAEVIGATLTVTSAPGAGTSVLVSLARDESDESRRITNAQ
jgi:PAS domain S-box-containing protein